MREMDSKSGESGFSGLGRGRAGYDRVFTVGTNAKKMVTQHSGVYSLVTGKTKWKSCFSHTRHNVPEQANPDSKKYLG